MPHINLTAAAAQVPWQTLSLSVGIAIGAILVLSPIAKKAGWVDRPSVRKAHQGDVPLIGGWAMLSAILVLQFAGPTELRAPAGYWVGATLLFFVALADDRFPIRARYRLIAQVGAAIAGISLGGQPLAHLGDLLGLGDLSAWWIVVPVSIFGIIALINAVNFMDGADGLCGGFGFIALFWFIVAVLASNTVADAMNAAAASHAASAVALSAATMGSLAGFLVFNLRTPWRRRATVFLGDSGSMLVGFTLAWVAVHVTTVYGVASVRPVTCLWIMALPLFDSASCIVRRILAGVTPMTPDMKHLHHLLGQFGFSVGGSVLVILAGAFLCGLFGVAGRLLEIPESTMFAAFMLALAAFVLFTNIAWRRIDRHETVPQRNMIRAAGTGSPNAN